jgi:hypothetical protein
MEHGCRAVAEAYLRAQPAVTGHHRALWEIAAVGASLILSHPADDSVSRRGSVQKLGVSSQSGQGISGKVAITATAATKITISMTSNLEMPFDRMVDTSPVKPSRPGRRRHRPWL